MTQEIMGPFYKRLLRFRVIVLVFRLHPPGTNEERWGETGSAMESTSPLPLMGISFQVQTYCTAFTCSMSSIATSCNSKSLEQFLKSVESQCKSSGGLRNLDDALYLFDKMARMNPLPFMITGAIGR